MIISKAYTFEASHQLPWHNGKCARLHGHSYILVVYVRGELDDNGIVLDFYDLSQLVNREVIEKYDHRNLNDYFKNPTAELMAQDFLQLLHSQDQKIFKVRLFETAKAYAEAEI